MTFHCHLVTYTTMHVATITCHILDVITHCTTLHYVIIAVNVAWGGLAEPKNGR
jgi:hypothetical protein